MAGVRKTKNDADQKPICKYGSKCYRKNAQHIQNYRHPHHDDDHGRIDDEKSKAGRLKPEKRKAGAIINDYSEKPRQSHDISNSDSEESNLDQSCKKKRDDYSESGTEDKKASSVEDDTSRVDVEEKDEDFDESPPVSPEDVKENIKRKFLVDMPDDFYQFWKFCQSLKPENPRSALEESLNLLLVGPFDILSGRHRLVRKSKPGRRPNFLLHYRFYYDPPEFQTVLASSTKSKFHLGYYRDDPKEEPVFVASNSPTEASAEKIFPYGENLFAAAHIYATKLLKSSSGKQKKSIEHLVQLLEQEAKTNNLSLADATKIVKARKKKVVCPTFHGAGIVVPVDANDVGYRPVPETQGDLRALFKRISAAKTESEREKHFEDLQELITMVQFANDECDYGEGLELGLDLFSFGGRVFHPQIAALLPLAYQLLNRPEFSTIIIEHLKHRREVAESVDELGM